MTDPAKQSEIEICEPDQHCHVLITQFLRNVTQPDSVESKYLAIHSFTEIFQYLPRSDIVGIVAERTTIQRGCKLATEDDDENDNNNGTSFISFGCSEDYCNSIAADQLTSGL